MKNIFKRRWTYMNYGTPFDTMYDLAEALDFMGEYGWQVERWMPVEDNEKDSPSPKKYFQWFILKRPYYSFKTKYK